MYVARNMRARNMRTDEEFISRHLCYALRYEFQSTDFVALCDLKRYSAKLNKYSEAEVREAVLKSLDRKRGSRFEVCDDPIRGFSIKVCFAVGRRRRGPVQQHLETPNAASSFDEVWSTEGSKEDEEDDDPRKLRYFLQAAFAWLSGQVEVPNTESLKYFIAHWDVVEKQSACVSMDWDRRRCLDCILTLFMSFEVVLQNLGRRGIGGEDQDGIGDVDQGEGWIGGGDRRWYNWNLTNFLATWELRKYDSSWRMSWRQVHLLFQQAVYK